MIFIPANLQCSSVQLLLTPFECRYSLTCVLTNLIGMLQKLGSVVFALSCTPAAFLAYNSTNNCNVDLWRDIMVISALSYLFVSFAYCIYLCVCMWNVVGICCVLYYHITVGIFTVVGTEYNLGLPNVRGHGNR